MEIHEDELSDYALADAAGRQRLIQNPAVTPGALFLKGLYHIQAGDVSEAADSLTHLEEQHSGPLSAELRALVHLSAWPDQPQRATTFIQDTLGLTFSDQPPPALMEDHSSQASLQLPSALDPASCSLHQLWEEGVQELAVYHAFLRDPALADAVEGGGQAALLEAGRQVVVLRDQLLGRFPRAAWPRLLQLATASAAGNTAPGVRPWMLVVAMLLRNDGAKTSTLLLQLLPGAFDLLLDRYLQLSNEVQASVHALADREAVLRLLGQLSGHQLEHLGEAVARVWERPEYVLARIVKMAPSGDLGVTEALSDTDWSAFLQRVEDLMTAIRCKAPASLLLDTLELGVLVARLAVEERQHGRVAVDSLVRYLRLGLDDQGHRVRKQTTGRYDQGHAPDFGALLPREPLSVAQLQRYVLGVLSDVNVPPTVVDAGKPLVQLLESHLGQRAKTQLVAEGMLLRGGSGSGDDLAWSRMYSGAGGDVAALQQRVELLLAPNNERAYTRGNWNAPVQLKLQVKNVPRLMVKVYELQTWNYYRSTSQEVDMGLDVEGLCPTWQHVVDLDTPPRVRRLVEVHLEPLQGKRGTFVVEAVGGGLQSRALLRRGGLRMVERLSAAGHALTLLYEDNSLVPVDSARVWVDGRELRADESSGEVVVPFRPAPSTWTSLVLGDGLGLATLVSRWQHHTEQYELTVGMYLDPETAVARCRAPLVLRPALVLGGTTCRVPLDLLTDVCLTVTTTDVDGVPTETVVHDFNLGDGVQAAVHVVKIPERCRQVQARLTARIALLLPGDDGATKYQDQEVAQSWQLYTGGSAGGVSATCSAHLTKAGDGYVLAVLGRAGETRAHIPVHLSIEHSLATKVTHKDLITDESGQVALGALCDVSSVSCQLSLTAEQESPPTATWRLAPVSRDTLRRAMPERLVFQDTGAEGQVRVPYPLPWWSSNSSREAAEDSPAALRQHGVALVSAPCGPPGNGAEGGLVLSNLTSRHVAAEPGAVLLMGLTPGHYMLAMLALDQVVHIEVLAAAVSSAAACGASVLERGGRRYVLGDDLLAELSEDNPLTIASFEVDASKGVRVQLRGSSRELGGASVQLVLDRFLPVRGKYAAEKLTPPRGPPSSWSLRLRRPSQQYQSNIALSEEVSYVLQRRQLVTEGRVRPGMLLDRPSLLVHPWVCGNTRTKVQLAKAGAHFKAMSNRQDDMCCEMACKRSYADEQCGRGQLFGASASAYGSRGAHHVADVADCGFLPPALLLTNLPVSADGSVVVSVDQLNSALQAALAGVAEGSHDSSASFGAAGLLLCRLVVLSHSSGAVYEALEHVQGASLLVQAPLCVKAMLERPFQAGTAATEARISASLACGADLVVPDLPSARLALYSTLAHAWTLFSTLISGDSCLGKEHLAVFKFLPTWGSLTADGKSALYDQYACRELDFFLRCKDPQFFEGVVRPQLGGKLSVERSFMDEWLLLVPDLGRKWTAPNRYQRLSACDKVLLAASGGPGAAQQLRQLATDMKQRYRFNMDRARLRRRYDIAVTALGERGDDATRQLEEDAALDTRSSGSDGDGAADDDEDEGGFVNVLHEVGGGGRGGGGPMRRMMAAPAAPMMAMAAPMMAMAPAPAPPPPPGGRPHLLASMIMRQDKSADASDMKKRQSVGAAAPAYRQQQATKEWAESGWYKAQHLDPEQVAPENAFWADWALHLADLMDARGSSDGGPAAAAEAVAAAAAGDKSGAFLPRSLEHAANSFSDAVLALAVLGLPFKDTPSVTVLRGRSLTLTASSPAIAVTKQIAAAGSVAEAGGAAGRSAAVVVLQRLLDPRQTQQVADQDDDENDEVLSGPAVVSGPVVAGRPYLLEVAISSNRENSQALDVTLLMPQGSVVLDQHPVVWTAAVHLTPFGMHQVRIPLYFPSSGTFSMFPASVARRSRLLAVAHEVEPHIQVLAKPPPPTSAVQQGDTPLTWRQLAEAPPSAASREAIVRYLAPGGGDVAAADLALVRWQCREQGFFQDITAALRARNIFDADTWSYAVLHRDEVCLREFLAAAPSSQARLLSLLGPGAVTPLVAHEVDVDAGALLTQDAYQHLEYGPFVNARAHALGGARKAVLNDELAAQWRRLLHILARQAQPTPHLRLEAAYYLALQDRLDEAEAIVNSLDVSSSGSTSSAAGASGVASALPSVQLCYLRGWLLLANAAATQQALAGMAAQVEGVRAVGAKWHSRLRDLAGQLKLAAGVTQPLAPGPTPSPPGAAAAASSSAPAEGDGADSAAARLVPYLSVEEGRTQGQLVVELANVDHVTLNMHVVDVELLFSSQPFGTMPGGSRGDKAAGSSSQRGGPAGGARGGSPASKFTFVQPLRSTRLDVAALRIAAGALAGLPGVLAFAHVPAAVGSSSKQDVWKLELDAAGVFPEAGNASVLFEVCGGGLSRSVSLYHCNLALRVHEHLGLVDVLDATTGAPVPAAYVKVFALQDGQAASSATFHKDGYTDRRGVFDLWLLTSAPPGHVARLALLVAHPTKGATVRHVAPPPH